MTLNEFKTTAAAAWRRIPSPYKSGIDGMIVEADVLLEDPDMDDVVTLGQCITESYPSAYGSADTIRSSVALYYGSFAQLARDEPSFDWDAEIWETLTHELQHHLESLAGDDALEEMDYAASENFKRMDGALFDAFFYREGEDVGDGVYRVDDEYFIERPMQAAGTLQVDWDGEDLRIRLPDTGAADVAYITVVDDAGPVHPPTCVVLVREVSGLRALAAMVRPRAPVVEHTEGMIA